MELGIYIFLRNSVFYVMIVAISLCFMFQSITNKHNSLPVFSLTFNLEDEMFSYFLDTVCNIGNSVVFTCLEVAREDKLCVLCHLSLKFTIKTPNFSRI
jgi:hypothetical protein